MAGKHYDLIVIGAGSGLKVSAAASSWGWKVAVIEEGPMGGTCLNRGCIPSKIIIHTADMIEEIRRAHEFGISVDYKGVDFGSVIRRATTLIDTDAANIEEGISADKNIDLYKTRGEFLQNKTIRAGEETISGERILIAAGSRPFVPPIPGLKEAGYTTSDEALRRENQPKRLAIIGGGYISTELGHFFGACGSEVTIIETAPLLVAREDGEIARLFTKLFQEKYKVLLEHKIKSIEKSAHAKVVVAEDKEGKEVRVEVDEILVTTGRKPNSDLLGLQNTAVTVNERGYILTNEYMETGTPGVWALGDIVGKAPFKHGANKEAEIVIANIKGGATLPMDYSIMPHAIFSSPQVAGVGLTEEDAKAKNIPYRVGKKEYRAIGMGQAIQEKNGFVKFIIGDDEKILGCHIIGPHASILVHEVVVAMTKTDGTVSSIRDAIHIHPALSEVVERALY